MLSTVKIAVIAGLYSGLVILLAPVSFYMFQIRVADALLILPFLDFFGLPSVIGLTVGCAFANIFSPFGVVDIVFGSLANLCAALIARLIGMKSKKLLALITASVLESLAVSIIVGYFVLHLVGGLDFIVAFVGVLVGSAISICILGVALVLFLVRGLKLS